MTIAMLLKNTLQAARMAAAAARDLRHIGSCSKSVSATSFLKIMEFGRVCRLVKDLGYDGLEIAPFTLAGLITELPPARRRELRAMVEDAGLETIGLHWLLAKTEGLYLTSPEESVRRATGDYLVALAEATRDLGGTLMVLGSPKQRSLLPGVSLRAGCRLRRRCLQSNHAERSAQRASTCASSRWRPTIPTSSTPASRELSWSARSVIRISSCTWM